MLTSYFIRALASLLDHGSQLTNALDDNTLPNKFQQTILLLVESIGSNQKSILNLHESIVSYLMPVLLAKINEDHPDQKYLCLKIMTDILVQLLDDRSQR